MSRVLIIDDEAPLLRNLSGYLTSLDPPFEVTCCSSGESGLVALEQSQFDVLLSDIRLPGIDGIDLLPKALKMQPHLKVVVITAFSTPSLCNRALHRGAIRVLEKPLDLGDLKDLLEQLVQPAAGWTGTVGGLELFDLIQLMVLTQRTRGLRVNLGRQEGILFFRQGTLVHASTSTLEGIPAFFHIVGWKKGRFREMTPEENLNCSTNIEASTTHLLLDAARLQDEFKRGRRQRGTAQP